MKKKTAAQMVEEIIRPNVGELSLFKKLERNNQPLSGGMIMDINGCSRSETISLTRPKLFWQGWQVG